MFVEDSEYLKVKDNPLVIFWYMYAISALFLSTYMYVDIFFNLHSSACWVLQKSPYTSWHTHFPIHTAALFGHSSKTVFWIRHPWKAPDSSDTFFLFQCLFCNFCLSQTLRIKYAHTYTHMHTGTQQIPPPLMEICSHHSVVPVSVNTCITGVRPQVLLQRTWPALGLGSNTWS